MALLWVPLLAHFLPTFLSDITKFCFLKESTNVMCYRYVDDNFAAFNNEGECSEFFSHLNSLHPLFCFTFEKECNRTFPFLDVLVEKNHHEFVTSIYRKPTFTGQYIHWNSFCPMKEKTNLISILAYRAVWNLLFKMNFPTFIQS